MFEMRSLQQPCIKLQKESLQRCSFWSLETIDLTCSKNIYASGFPKKCFKQPALKCDCDINTKKSINAFLTVKYNIYKDFATILQ